MDQSQTGSTTYQPISELELFKKFESVADWSWDQVSRWKSFAQNSIGRQLVESADSVGANLVEGGGRGGDVDATRFFFYARGSASEAKLWINRAIRRGLVSKEEGLANMSVLEEGIKMLNSLIAYRRNASKGQSKGMVREERLSYADPGGTHGWLDDVFSESL